MDSGQRGESGSRETIGLTVHSMDNVMSLTNKQENSRDLSLPHWQGAKDEPKKRSDLSEHRLHYFGSRCHPT